VHAKRDGDGDSRVNQATYFLLQRADELSQELGIAIAFRRKKLIAPM